jgi:hypothetical protein
MKTTIDFQKFYRLSTFRVRIWAPKEQKNTPILYGLGYLFRVAGCLMSFFTISRGRVARSGDPGGELTNSHMQAILRHRHGVFTG